MHSRILIGLTFLLLAACAADQRPVSETDLLKADISAREAELRDAQGRIAALHAELGDAEKKLRDANRELDDCRRRTAHLENELALMQQRVDSIPSDLTALQNELDASRAAERQANTRARNFRSQVESLDDEVDELRNQLAAISMEPGPGLQMSPAGGRDPEAAAADAVAIDRTAAEPHLKTVYYATNRVRLERSWKDYVAPFWIPLVLLVLVLLLFRFIRRYIKDEYQGRARLLTGVVGGAAVLFTVGTAIQDTAQMRQRDGSLIIQYGNELRKPGEDGSPYERGKVEVSIPPKRNIGEVPRPELVKFEFIVDPTKHFQLASIRPSSSDRFYEELREAIADDKDKSAFVFVHGFHNTFEDAAFRTAQIAEDMEFPGAPLFFSWPSQGAVLDYLTDAKNVSTTVLHLRQFIEELHAESGATRIHLVAHSMGSRALAQAVDDLAREGVDTSRLGQLVFAAPDIAKDLLEQKVPALDRVSQGVTLYASAHDSALKLSRALQGRDAQNYQRAGETHPSPMVSPPMQTIDVSLATSGHSYISDSPVMMRDLSALFSGSRVLDPAADNYVPVDDDSGYWLLLDPE